LTTLGPVNRIGIGFYFTWKDGGYVTKYEDAKIMSGFRPQNDLSKVGSFLTSRSNIMEAFRGPR
jgi:hypothetical protein